LSKAFKYLPIFLTVFFIQGCSLLSHYDQMIALKRVGDSQDEIEGDLRRQKDSFNELKADIENKHLKRGSSKSHILFRYGQPVFCKEAKNKTLIRQVCIYRLSGSNLDAGLIYLYFDGKNKLDLWDIIK